MQNISRLIRRLDSKSARKRAAAAERLSALGINAEAALPALFSKLQDPVVNVRVKIVEAIGCCGTRKAAIVIPELVRASTDPVAVVRSRAVRSIALFAPLASNDLTQEDQVVLHVLTKALRDTDPDVVIASAKALIFIGTGAQEAAPVLKALMESASFRVREVMRKALYAVEGRKGAASDGVRGTRMIPDDDVRPEVTPVSEPIELTVYGPREVRPELWYSLLTYVHVSSARCLVQMDSRKHINFDEVREISNRAKTDVARGALIDVIPELPGFVVNPTYSRISWLEDWHRLEFRIRVLPEDGRSLMGQAVNGRVAFYVEGLLVGEVPISVFIERDAPSQRDGAATQNISKKPYQSVFVSYSHKDDVVVDKISAATKTLGMTFLRDQEVLRSGEEWNRRLLHLISEAEIFQLFWSENAKKSPHVQREWEHAISLRRQNFIRPLYWEKPVSPPPDQLAHLHFSYYPMTYVETN